MKNNGNPGGPAGYFRRRRERKQKWMEDVADTVLAVRQRDPAAKSTVEVLLLYSGVHAMMAYRVANRLHREGHFLSARAVSQLARHLTGIEIHPGATIGRGLFIDHGMGVVIGETAEIGDNCTIYQGVTLGGTGKDVGKRHPTLGDNVMIGAGAKVLGPVKIGSNSKIAAGAVVLREVPENSTAVGIPAKVVRRDGMRVQADLDQIHIPDPVAQEFCRLRAELRALERRVQAMAGAQAFGTQDSAAQGGARAAAEPGPAGAPTAGAPTAGTPNAGTPAAGPSSAGAARSAVAGEALYRRALAALAEGGNPSGELLCRRLGVPPAQSAALLERMEAEGLVSPPGPGGYRCLLADRAGLLALSGEAET